jgi:uroporphyrin-III C-methyltransferase
MKMVDEHKQSPQARVTLVGAGPGDPDLLTIAAVKAIASADVILVDDLVHPDVLAHASPSARIVHVGKRGPYCRQGVDRAIRTKRPSTPQAFIERLMRFEARKGLHVVRLKGGDPYVFGRGGEERAYLMKAGIEVRIIPGISSGIAAPASIGIPVTHRDWSQGVIFVTGHRKRGQDADECGADQGAAFAPDLDWSSLAKTGLTLVVYMGVGRSRSIVDALIAGGMRSDMPAAAVQSAWTAQQRQVVGTLATLPDDIVASGIASPAILVIGDVVRCADQQWLRLAEETDDPSTAKLRHVGP